jgi:hypothetical protein
MFANMVTIAFDAGWHGPQTGHRVTGAPANALRLNVP